MSRYLPSGITRGRMAILSVFVVTLLTALAIGFTVSSGAGSADFAPSNQSEVTTLQGQVQALEDEVQAMRLTHEALLKHLAEQHARQAAHVENLFQAQTRQMTIQHHRVACSIHPDTCNGK